MRLPTVAYQFTVHIDTSTFKNHEAKHRPLVSISLDRLPSFSGFPDLDIIGARSWVSAPRSRISPWNESHVSHLNRVISQTPQLLRLSRPDLGLPAWLLPFTLTKMLAVMTTRRLEPKQLPTKHFSTP